MRVLALDTTTRTAAAALVENDRVVAERTGDPLRTHAEQLPGDLMSLLSSAGVTLSAIDVFAVASGPGSFTGLRIGIATMQGLAFVTRRRIVAISALEALAHAGGSALPQGAIVAAWMDARRRDVFSALYRISGVQVFAPDRLTELDPPSVGDPATTLSRWSKQFDPPVVFIGDGAVLYGEVIKERGRVVAPPPLAGTIGQMALQRASASDSIDPAAIQPLYVRRSDAEIARDRKRCND
jgi:tRNA threonylcarbamoyladenosine biosynthesis protein TsaB